MIVASVNPAAVTPALLHSWLGSIRGQLRAGDFAGMLSDSEIAVLLCDASADDAAVVSSRLKQLIETEQNDGVLVQPAFSTTTRTPELPFEGSLVRCGAGRRRRDPVTALPSAQPSASALVLARWFVHNVAVATENVIDVDSRIRKRGS